MENEIVNKGKLTCNKKILCSIVSLATREIGGVSSLKSNFKSKFLNLFSSEKVPGVLIKFNPNGNVIVDVYITVENGCSIPDVAYRVQENIKNNIASMVDMRTSKVNVHIVGVDFNDEKTLAEENLWEENQGIMHSNLYIKILLI